MAQNQWYLSCLVCVSLVLSFSMNAYNYGSRKVIDGTKNDKQKSNSHQHATRDRASNFSASTNTISALFDTTRRLFGHGTSSSSSSSSETRQNTTSSMPGSYTRQQRRFDPNSDYMNLDLD